MNDYRDNVTVSLAERHEKRRFVEQLMGRGKERAASGTVCALVDSLSENPAAKLTAQEIAERVQKAAPG